MVLWRRKKNRSTESELPVDSAAADSDLPYWSRGFPSYGDNWWRNEDHTFPPLDNN